MYFILDRSSGKTLYNDFIKEVLGKSEKYKGCLPLTQFSSRVYNGELHFTVHRWSNSEVNEMFRKFLNANGHSFTEDSIIDALSK